MRVDASSRIAVAVGAGDQAGTHGDGPGEFEEPTGIAVHQGRVYVFARPPIEPGRSLVGIDAAADGALWTTGMTWHEIARWSDLDRD